MGNGGKFVLGAALAAAAGYIAGVLTAPQSGKETREDIKVAAEKARVELTELTERAKVEATKLSGKAKEEVHKAIELATHARDKVANVAKNGTTSDKDFDKSLAEAKAALDHLKTFLTK